MGQMRKGPIEQGSPCDENELNKLNVTRKGPLNEDSPFLETMTN